MIERLLLKEPDNPESAAVFWNTLATLFSAVASVVLLMFVTRVCGTVDAGIFSIGYSTAQMLFPIGQYGMRNFQASDVQGRFRQEDYLASRVITCTWMLIGAVAFVAVKGYNGEKAIILLLMVLLKATDCVDDVFGGYYQLNRRLDIGGKIQFSRIILYILAFLATLLCTGNTVIACVAAVATASVVLICLISVAKRKFPVVKPAFNKAKQKKLLLDCLPLCLSAFLVVYMSNVPKYAIDAYMTSEFQAIYNYLFMPCYIVCLFMTFALQPLIVKISILWVQNEIMGFKRICGRIFALTALLSAVVVACGYFVGCLLLGWFYGVDLSIYRYELTVVLIGGAFYAAAIIIQTMLTVMRRQRFIIAGFAVSGVLITIAAPLWVSTSGIMGACCSYLLAAGALFVILLLSFIKQLFDSRRTG